MSVTEGATGDPEELRELAALLKWAADKIEAEKHRTAIKLKAATPEGSKDTLTVEVDGVEVPWSVVSRTRPKLVAKVTDRGALLKWAKLVYPEYVQTVTPRAPEPYDELLPGLLASIKVTKTGALVGPNGEADIPGVEVGKTVASSVTVRNDNDAIDQLWPILRERLAPALELALSTTGDVVDEVEA